MKIAIHDLVSEKILEIRGEHVILDFDIADLYKVETRDINKAVKNSPNTAIGGVPPKQKLTLVA